MRKSSKLFTILSAAMCVTALGAAPCYAEEVTINFWHHYSEQSAENETLNDVLIPEFEKENPDISGRSSGKCHEYCANWAGYIWTCVKYKYENTVL